MHVGDGSKLQALQRVFQSCDECKIPFEGPGIVILASPDLPMSITGTAGHGNEATDIEMISVATIPTGASTVTVVAYVQDVDTLGDEATVTISGPIP